MKDGRHRNGFLSFVFCLRSQVSILEGRADNQVRRARRVHFYTKEKTNDNTTSGAQALS